LTAEAYLWFKALHIIGVIVWFSGLFYLVRLFIYHEESRSMEDELKIAFNNQYTLMEKRLANIITTPGMILALSMAICMVIMQPSWLSEKWLQIKISFVLGLVIYHYFCYKIMNSLQNGTSTISAKNLRLLNELPTLLLFIIVLLVIFKNNFPTSIATWSVVGLIIFMLASIQLYAKIRKKNEQKVKNE
jgi:putative membrane protein